MSSGRWALASSSTACSAFRSTMTSARGPASQATCVDLAALAAAYRDDNPKKGNVGLAMAAIVGCTIADFAAAQSIRSLHNRKGEPVAITAIAAASPRGSDIRVAGVGQVPQDFRATLRPRQPLRRPTGETSPASADLHLEVSA